jgi:nucleoside-diphosphate-sugar epimerase
MRVLITGASGFIGQHVARTLQARSKPIRLVTRHHPVPSETGAEVVRLRGAGQSPEDWREAVDACDAIVHLAARAHVLKEHAANPLAVFREANVQFSLACAEAAIEAGVRRFVFVSSVGVHGNQTHGKPFEAHNDLAPCTPYAQSKMEAERALTALCRSTGMELVVVRPPLVYGPRAPGNFASLLHALQRGIPLPLGAVTANRRSLVALDNLVDLLLTCIHHPAAAGEAFLVSDNEDLSTTDLLRRMGAALGHPAKLVPLPPRLLHWCAATLGKGDTALRLLGDLQVDIAHTQKTLGWAPPISVDEGLRLAAAGTVQP